MKRFTVKVFEVYIRHLSVEAETEEEARESANIRV